MKLSCQRNDLNEIINVVQRSVSNKAFEYSDTIKIDASANGQVIFTANSSDSCIIYNSELNVSEGGQICLASKMFGDIVRLLPNDMVSLSVNGDNNITTIKSCDSEFNIQGIIYQEFPQAPNIGEYYTLHLTNKELKKILKKVLSFYALQAGRRPVLTGILFNIKENNVLENVASDGHRLSIVKTMLHDDIKPCKFIIPGATLSEMIKVLKDDDSMIEIRVGEKTALFKFENFDYYTRLIEGEFIQYEAFINVENSIKVFVDNSIFKSSLERANIVIEQNTVDNSGTAAPVRLNIGFNKIEITTMTHAGKFYDVVPASIEGENITIGFNCKFLIDALNASESDTVKIELTTPTSGCFVKSTDDLNEFLFMILPVRLYN